MEPNRAIYHAQRVRRLLECFHTATKEITLTLEQALEAATQYYPRNGGWSATQIGYHAGLTLDWFAGAFGRTGATLPFRGESDFPDEYWNLDAPPMGVQVPAILQPPSRVSRQEAVECIRKSAERLHPFLRDLTAEDGAEMCVTVPWATISLYQLAEWAGGHTLRHLGQMRRALAEYGVSQRKMFRAVPVTLE